MHATIYERLADLLDSLPNGFPRTPSNIEVRLLQKIFSHEEAELALHLTGRMEPIDTLAGRMGLPIKEARAKLMAMVKRELVWFDKLDGSPYFRLAPFVVGVWEGQLESMDKELAELFEQYMADGGAAGIMKYQPALQRVLPAEGTVETEWILPYEDVRAILEQAQTFSVRDCVCRVQQDQLGRQCDFPVHNCLMFSMKKRPPKPNDINRAEALAIIDEAKEIGLVHSVSNIKEGVSYICNCCGCCCGILRGITRHGIANSVAQANYYAVIDENECQNCGLCIERCQVDAINAGDDFSVVDRPKCIGCGVCVTGCPDDAVHLVRKPADQIIEPPADFPTWEHQRLQNRGMADL